VKSVQRGEKGGRRENQSISKKGNEVANSKKREAGRSPKESSQEERIKPLPQKTCALQIQSLEGRLWMKRGTPHHFAEMAQVILLLSGKRARILEEEGGIHCSFEEKRRPSIERRRSITAGGEKNVIILPFFKRERRDGPSHGGGAALGLLPATRRKGGGRENRDGVGRKRRLPPLGGGKECRRTCLFRRGGKKTLPLFDPRGERGTPAVGGFLNRRRKACPCWGAEVGPPSIPHPPHPVVSSPFHGQEKIHIPTGEGEEKRSLNSLVRMTGGGCPAVDPGSFCPARGC